MLGAIIGDLIGSTYEETNTNTKDFPLFTSKSRISDDSIMTLAVADIIQKNSIYDKDEIIDTFKAWAMAYPDRGYGVRFANWVFSNAKEPYYSMGNGAAMRISPVGWYARSLSEVKDYSKRITEVTHNHPDAIKAAEVVASLIYYARRGKSKQFLKEYIEKYYDIDFDYEDLKNNYTFDATCEGSVPQALYCFLISESFIDCLRTSISIGGDSDTIPCIACSIAEAYYKHINPAIIKKMYEYLPQGDPNPYDVISQFLYDMEDDYVTSEVLTSKHHIIYVLENGVGFYGHARRIIVLKDYIIERLNRACFNKMNTVKRMLKYINSYEDLKDTIDYINTLTIDYDISFKLFKNSKDAGLK